MRYLGVGACYLWVSTNDGVTWNILNGAKMTEWNNNGTRAWYYDVTINGEGTYRIRTHPLDNAGNWNWSAYTEEYVVVDRTAPIIGSITAPQYKNTISGGTIPITVSGITDAGGSGLNTAIGDAYYLAPGGEWSEFNRQSYSNGTFTFNMPVTVEGTYTIRMAVTDNAGNVTSKDTYVYLTWKATTITSMTDTQYKNTPSGGTVAVTASGIIDNSGSGLNRTCGDWYYWIPGAADWQPLTRLSYTGDTSTFNMPVTVEGDYMVRMWAHNIAGTGNYNTTHVIIDRTRPTATSISDTLYTTTGTVTSSIYGVSDASGIKKIDWYIRNGDTFAQLGKQTTTTGSGTTYSATVDLSSYGEGHYVIGGVITDNAGNEYDVTETYAIGWTHVYYDSTIPTIGSITDAQYKNTASGNNISITLNNIADTGSSGLKSVNYAYLIPGASDYVYKTASNTASTYTFNIPITVEGTYRVAAVAYDAAGNHSQESASDQWKRTTIIVDRTVPTATATSVNVGQKSSFTISDNLSGVNGWQVTNNTTKPTSGWTTIATPIVSQTTISDTVNREEGTYYLWVKDRAENVSAYASFDVSVIANYSNGTNNFETIENAIAGTASGGTITVLQNVTDSSTATFPSGKTLTLNTNGKILTKMSSAITNNGTFTISGNGSIITTADFGALINNEGTLNILNVSISKDTGGGNLLRNNGTLTTNNATLTKNNYGYALENYAIANITGGSISSVNYNTIYNKGGNVTVTGTTITSQNDASISNIDAGEVTINNGTTVQTTAYGNCINNEGTLTVNTGVAINNTGSGSAIYNANSGEVYINGGEFTALIHALSNNVGNITIAGTPTLSSTNESAISNWGGGDITITGGTFIAATGSTISNSNGILDVTGAIINNTNSGACIWNSSEFHISGTAINGSSGNAIYNGGVMTISNNSSIVVTQNGCGIYNNNTGSVTLSDTTINTQAGDGINNSINGVIEIQSGCEITSTGTTIRNLDSGIVNMLGGTLKSLSGTCIENAATITCGTKDGNVSKAVPSLQGAVYGINNSGTLNFYDGIFKGKSKAINGSNPSDKETGYAVHNGTQTIDSETYNIAYLAKDISASNITVTVNPTSYPYTGSSITPTTVIVKDVENTLTVDVDYTLSYTNNINIGTATVTVTGKGNYTGTKTANFTIEDATGPSITNIQTTSTTNTITVTATVTDANDVASITYNKTTSDVEPTTGWQVSNTLTDLTANTAYYVWIKAVDTVGNETVVRVTKATTGVAGNITLTPSTTAWTNQNVTVTIEWPTTTLTKQIKVGSGAWQDTTATTQLIEENTTIQARLTDGTNNGTPASLTIANIDKGAPTATSISGSIYTNNASVTTYMYGVTDSISGIKKIDWYIRNEASFAQLGKQTTTTGSGTTYSVTFDLSSYGEGHYIIGGIITDNANNQYDVTELYALGWTHVYYDTTIPTATATTVGAGEKSSFTISDNLSGVDGWQVTTSTTIPTNGWTTIATPIVASTVMSDTINREEGTYYLWVKDRAGNVSNGSAFEVTPSNVTATVNNYNGVYDGNAHALSVDVTIPNLGAEIYYNTSTPLTDSNYQTAAGTIKVIDLPTEYKQVEYLESTGTQYIRTGFIPNQNTGFDVTFLSKNVASTTGYGAVLGARTSSRVNDIQLTTFTAAAETTWAGTIRFGTTSNNANITLQQKQRATLRNKVYTDPTGATTTLVGDFTSPTDISIFGLNQNGSVIQNGKVQVYELKLYDGNVLVRNFVPCVRTSDNVAGMYDLVTRAFYTNEGTGTFSVGAEVTAPTRTEIGTTNVYYYITKESYIPKAGSGTITIESDANYYNGTDGFETLKDAIAGTESGGTITVMKNVTDVLSATIPLEKTLTLDLNGKTVIREKSITNEGTFNIIGSGAIKVATNVNLLANNEVATLNGTFSLISSATSSATITNRATLNINLTDGGKIESTTFKALWNNNKVTITSGTIIGATYGIHNTGAETTAGIVTIGTEGGGVSNTLPEIIGGDIAYYGETDKLTLYDGIFKGVTEAMVQTGTPKVQTESGYSIFFSNDDTYKTATLGNAVYHISSPDSFVGTLYNAINNASTGATITLMNSAIDSTTATIPSTKVLTLDLNGKTLTRTALITNNGTLTVSGSGTLQTFTDNNIFVNNKDKSLTFNGEISFISGAKSQAAVSNRGTLNINLTGTGKIEATAFKAIWNARIVNLNSGTVKAANYGIQNVSSSGQTGTTTIGKSDGIVSIASPVVIGSTGYFGSAGTLNFYDGIIKGTEEAISNAAITVTETNYGIRNDTEGTYKTAYLAKKNVSATISPTNVIFTSVGDTETLTVSVLPTDAEETTYMWTTSDENVVTINGTTKTATITCVSTGTATITVVVTDITGSSIRATCNVVCDITPPTATVLPNPIVIGNGSVTITLEDSGVGVNSYAVTKTNQKPTTWQSITTTPKTSVSYTPDAVGTYYVWAKDATGNGESSYATTFEVVDANYSIGTKYYATLNSAFADVTSTNTTIKVLNNVTESPTATLTSDKVATINLSGKTITVSEQIVNNATLTIVGAGTITSSASADTIRNTYRLIVNGDVTIANTNELQSAIHSSSISAITGNDTTTAAVQVLKGTIVSSGDCAIYNNGSGTIYVNGGEVRQTASYGAIVNHSSGTIRVDSGNIISRLGTALHNYKPNSSIIVNGGTIRGGSAALRNTEAGTSITITGGTIIATNGNTECIANNNATGTVTIGTNDGTINKNAITITSAYKGYSGAAGSVLNFYDGTIKAINSAIDTKGTINTPTGYGIYKSSEEIEGNTYKTATLELGWDISKTPGTDNVWSFLTTDPNNNTKYIMTIQGTGAMKNFANYDDVPWVNHRNVISELIIEEGVTTIGDRAFYNLDGITKTTTSISDIRTGINLPSTINYIGGYSFYSCDLLRGIVTIPQSVTNIRQNPFLSTPVNTYIVESSNISYKVVNGALLNKAGTMVMSYPYGATATSHIVPDGVTDIYSYAYSGARFTEVTLPETLLELSYAAFQGAKITSIVIPSSVTEINEYAFNATPNLKTVYIKSQTISVLGNYAFTRLASGSIIYTTSKTIADKFVANTNYTATNTTIYYPPFISTQPTNKSVTYPATATFNVGASNGVPTGITYQWQLSTDGGTTFNNISGATNASYTTSATTISMNGYKYRCIISSAEYPNDIITREDIPTTISNVATLSVNKSEITGNVRITGSAKYGSTLTANTDGLVPNNCDLAYQWWYSTSSTATSGTNITGETGSTYKIGNGMIGRYIGVTVVAAKENYNTKIFTDITDNVNSDSSKVERVSVVKPTLKSGVTYMYTGATQTASLDNFNSGIMTISNNTRVNAGTQNITIALKDTTNYQWADKTTANVTISWTIAKRSVTVVWGEQTSFVYDATAKAPTVTGTSGVAGETITLIRTTQTSVGNHTSTASIEKVTGGQALVDNYVITNPTKQFTITNAVMSVVASDYVGDYDGNAHGITVVAPEGSTIKYGTILGNYNQTVNPTYVQPGVYTVYFEVVRENYATVHDNRTVTIYGIPTVPTITVKDSNEDTVLTDTWINKDLDITISGSTLRGPGVVKYQYSLDGVNWSDYTTAIEQTEETLETIIRARAVNSESATAISNVQTFTVKIDKTKPVVTKISEESVIGEIVVINLSDRGGSGIAGWQVTTNNTEPTEWIATNSADTVNYTCEIEGEVYFWAIDAAGNISLASSKLVVNALETTNSITCRFIYDDIVTKAANYEINLLIKARARITYVSINGVEIDITEYTQDKNGQEYSLNIPYKITTNGIYELKAIDIAENQGVERKNIIVFDRTAPVVKYEVRYPTESSKNAVIVFNADKEVSVYTGNGVNSYTNKVKTQNGELYSAINVLEVDANYQEESFYFVDRAGNISNKVTIKLSMSQAKLTYVRLVDATTTSVSNIDNLSIENAYYMVREMNNKYKKNASGSVLYYGINTSDSTMIMSRARDVGAAEYITKASNIMYYDGTTEPQTIPRTASGSSNHLVTYGLAQLGVRNEILAAYSEKMRNSNTHGTVLLNESMRNKDVIPIIPTNYRGIKLVNTTGLTSESPFILLNGQYTYTFYNGVDTNNKTFRVTLINK